MSRMIKRFLAAVLITSMLMGSNGISYAAEIADGDSVAGTEEVTQEAVDEEQVESPEDAEASEPANEESAEENCFSSAHYTVHLYYVRSTSSFQYT